MKVKFAVLVCVVFVFGIFTSWVLAQSSNTNTYTACVNNSSGTIHILNDGETCANNEVLIQWKPAGTIGAAEVALTHEHIIAWGGALRAFIPTNSTSTKCLVTLAEGGVVDSMDVTVFCAHRNFEGQDGILISAFYPGMNLLPPEGPLEGQYLQLTVYQEGAEWYGPPVLYTGS